MKILKIPGHPYLLITSFLLLLISGEHLGGFYSLYILLALPHAGMHAILAIGGIGLILVSCHGNFFPAVAAGMNTMGIACMILSLYWFFSTDTSNYNLSTFYQTGPVISFSIFGLFIICSLIKNVISIAAPAR